MTHVAARLLRLLPITFVIGLSLVVLIYVGFGEALKTYPQYQDGRLAAEGQIVQGAMEQPLVSDVPIHQFIGFDTLTAPILRADPTLLRIVVTDSAETVVFEAHQEDVGDIPLAVASSQTGAHHTTTRPQDAGYRVVVDDEFYHVVLPLRGSLAVVGHVTLTMARQTVVAPVNERFLPLGWAMALAVVGFLVVALAIAGLSQPRFTLWVNVLYAVTFLGMSTMVVLALISLYSSAIEQKNRGLTTLLGSRLAALYELGMAIGDVSGLDQIFTETKRLNPEIREIALTVGGTIALDTDAARVGMAWRSNPADYEYTKDVATTDSNAVRLSVSVPFDVVLWQLARSIKNFIVLFIASFLVATLFLRLATTTGGAFHPQAPARSQPPPPGDAENKNAETNTPAHNATLELIKPVFFLVVFVESLNASFLPQLMQQSASEAGLSGTAVSLLFMIYFLCFALVLVPADRVADAIGPRPVLLVGVGLSCLGALLMAIAGMNVATIASARILSGLGQGLLLIGVQSYILNIAGSTGTTAGASIIVLGFNGGMISGAAIGALLVTHMHPVGVFTVSSLILLGIGAYILILLANPRPKDAPVLQKGLLAITGGMARDIVALLTDLTFMKAMLMVGLPAKAALTGVIFFAMPLVLSRLGFAQEDIGQIIMFYAGGILLVGGWVARVVDNTGRTKGILFGGSAMGGVAVVVLGFGCVLLTGHDPTDAVIGTSVVVGAVFLLGLSHGCVYAPIVTHIVRTDIAHRVGINTTATNYRFLERLGHVGGPLVAGQVLMTTHNDPMAIAYIGFGILALAALFLMPTPERKRFLPE